jgi:glycosyltransferase involved in cell wall biosynthesis
MHCEWLVELPRDAIARRLERVDLVLGVSSHIVRQVQDAHPHVADRCRVLPNGVDPVVFAPRDETLATRPAAIAMLRARLRARGPLLLYVGRLSSEKGVHVLLEAFARVRTRHPAATCAIVGPDWGPIRKVRPAGGSAVGEVIARLDHGYMEHLRRLAAVHGDRVVFAGPVPNEDLPVWYAAADVLVVPSLLEAFGIPAIEGAACALPVVAAATGGLVDTVDATTGIVVPPGDAAALGDALAALLAEPVRARALGRAGRARVLAHYTWDRVADMLAGYYDALLPGAPAPGVYRNVAIDASRSTHSPGTSASSPPNCLQ